MDRTREKWKCPLFGDTCDLKENMLPTYEDVMKFYEWNRRKIKLDKDTKKEPTYKEIEAIVVAKIVEIWGKASIPTIQLKGIKVMLKAYHLKCKNLLKSYPKIPEKKLEEFRRSSRVLFDISSCKCTNISECTCPREKKVPKREHSFLIDQRSARKMFIGAIDTATTSKLAKTLKRKLNKPDPKVQPQKKSKQEPNISVSSESENVSMESPSQNLVDLATYVVKAYAPTWFAIKTHPTCKDGARHLYHLVSATRYLPAKLKAIVDPVIQRNGYFAHPENLLLAMLTDSQQHIRELGARRILKARTNKENRLRLFQLPVLNLNASSYVDLIDWQDKITEPPVLKQIPDEVIQTFVEEKGKGDSPLLRLPCHSQAVERAVKTVTEASAKLSKRSAREGFIKAQIESRRAMPKFDSKQDFKAN
ncbi:hypothetical protein PYW07_006299 [Mythimna separata]|uniref:Uncharacterized protein n=1 Tax=Mythimna separata TaxID=271217 RepID=A0AAD7YV16_MYTSE|nr:hypothetical protein PYW07_006299 [Mythimna separata]